MNDTQLYQFKSEEPLQDEDDYDCFKKPNHRRKREVNWEQ